MSKQQPKAINPFIFVLICACLAWALYISLGTIALSIWGSTVPGKLTGYSSQLTDHPSALGRSRTVMKYYSFKVGGKEYKSWVRYQSDEAWPDLAAGESRPELISYLPLFPRLNKPSHLADLSSQGPAAAIYHIIALPGCLFLFWLVLKQQKKARRIKSTSLPPET